MCFRMFPAMTNRFELTPTDPVDLAGRMAATWRRDATALRRQLDEVTVLAHDLAAYHRPDVWQGAVATRFGDELEHWRARLGRDRGVGLGAELLALADRLDARAFAAEQPRAGAIEQLWARTPTAAGP